MLNGDIADFLAEEPFETFTQSRDIAKTKFERIIKNTSEIWDALRNFIASGGMLTLLLGNHDLELSLPENRQLLMNRLGPGCIDFLYDNQAVTFGPVLIEHGNSYDSWNTVKHDVLRHVRSAFSRNKTPHSFPNVPGSALVANVINDIKKQYGFIDLLKPETAAMLPLLVVLEPSVMKELNVVTVFCQLLVENLIKYGKLEDGRDALEAVLESAKNRVGRDKSEYCDMLIQELRSIREDEGLSFEFKAKLTDALLFCSVMSNRNIRNSLINELRHDIKATIIRTNVDRNDVINIIL